MTEASCCTFVVAYVVESSDWAEIMTSSTPRIGRHGVDRRFI